MKGVTHDPYDIRPLTLSVDFTLRIILHSSPNTVKITNYCNFIAPEQYETQPHAPHPNFVCALFSLESSLHNCKQRLLVLH